MKLKYQLRGLGIGIVVTALLMGVATKDSFPLSDAEIKAKALTLGMVEIDSLKLTDIQNTPYPSGTEADSDGTPDDAAGDDVGDGSGESGDEASGDGTDSEDGAADSDGASGDGVESGATAPADGTEGQDTESGDGSDREVLGSGITEDGTVEVHIERGMSSYRASVVIAEAGLVEDAAAFDRYLCAEGYSRKIADGTYQIPFGATEEEIAVIITKGR